MAWREIFHLARSCLAHDVNPLWRRAMTIPVLADIMATKIKLLAKDGKEFEVEKEVACLSKTVKNMVEGEPEA